MRLALDEGFRRLALGVERVEVLLQAGIARYASVDGAAEDLAADHGATRGDGLWADRAARLGSTEAFSSSAFGRSPPSFSPAFVTLSRRPKKRGPFHLVPVMANATLLRLS